MDLTTLYLLINLALTVLLFGVLFTLLRVVSNLAGKIQNGLGLDATGKPVSINKAIGGIVQLAGPGIAEAISRWVNNQVPKE